MLNFIEYMLKGKVSAPATCDSNVKVVSLKYIDSEIERNESDDKPNRVITTKGLYIYDEGLEAVGHGRYHRKLLAVLSLVLFAMVTDMIGFNVVVFGSSCELQLTQQQQSILNSTSYIGAILMSYVWGYLSDTQGRRKSLLFSTGISFIMTTLSSFSPNWIVLFVTKLIGVSFCCCAHSATYALLGESCILRVRGSYMLIMTSALMIFPVFSYGLAYYILPLNFSINLGTLRFTPWRLLSLILALPLGLGFLGLLSLYESPKFLVNLKRDDEAVDVLKKIWTKNGGEPEEFAITCIVLNERRCGSSREGHLLKSIWEQTTPLFKPPLLLRTLQLYYLCVVIYGTNNSFGMWYPFIAEAFFTSIKSGALEDNGFCNLLTMSGANTTSTSDNTDCKNGLEANTVYGGIAMALFLTIFNLLITKLASKRKLLMIGILLLSAGSGLGTGLTPEPISAIAFYILLLATVWAMGPLSSYFVDLYPTSYRGLVACLGVVVARSSALAGTNLVGAFIMTHCYATFSISIGFLLSGVIVACYLPPDKPVAR